MYEILSSIREKYYDEIPEFGNSYRNLVMHANRFLMLEKDDMFEELLTDYSKLIKSVWGDAVMPYDKKRVELKRRILMERYDLFPQTHPTCQLKNHKQPLS